MGIDEIDPSVHRVWHEPGDASADSVCSKLLSRAKLGMAFAPNLPVMTFEEAYRTTAYQEHSEMVCDIIQTVQYAEVIKPDVSPNPLILIDLLD